VTTPCLSDVQSDQPGNLESRVGIPATRVAGNYTAGKVAQDLSPIIVIDGEPFTLETPCPGAFPAGHPGCFGAELSWFVQHTRSPRAGPRALPPRALWTVDHALW
jgi:hypothetical protein